MPEQLIFEQALALPRAIKRHELPLRPPRVIVHRPRDQFLARPALPGDQHRDRARRDRPDRPQDLPHRLATRHDPLEAILGDQPPQLPRLDPNQHLLRRPIHDLTKNSKIQRFLDKVERPLLERGPRRRNITMSRDHDRLGLRLQFRGPAQNHQPRVGAIRGDPVLAPRVRHPQIGDDHIKRPVRELVDRARNTRHNRAHMPGLPQRVRHDIRVIGLVLDDQHLRRGGILVLRCVAHRRTLSTLAEPDRSEVTPPGSSPQTRSPAHPRHQQALAVPGARIPTQPPTEPAPCSPTRTRSSHASPTPGAARSPRSPPA